MTAGEFMQPYGLTVDKLIDHAAKWHGNREIAAVAPGGTVERIRYSSLRDRANCMSGALLAIGLRPGDRLATLAWNTQHHLEMYYATMGIGLICHTLNPRVTDAHIAAMINEAADRVVAVSITLLPQLERLLHLCPGVEHILVMDNPGELGISNGSSLRVDGLEDLLAAHGAPVRWGEFDENTPAGLCYTSGTTGRPKGVVFTHRSNYLHALTSIQPNAYCLSESDVVLAAVPLFHANAWGLPFMAPAVGAGLVLPGRDLGGASMAALMMSERVTLACGVPTVWLGLLDHLAVEGSRLPDLKRIIVGGSKCPDSLILRMEAELGVTVQTSWGMTELSPIGTVDPPHAPRRAERASGRPPLGVDLLLSDQDDVPLPDQRGNVGRLKVKGASTVQSYFGADKDAVDANGYFDTGDLATIDASGNLSICGRSKDLIKSGGEWINPAEIEEIVGRDPHVALAAVIAAAHPRWGERPVLVVEARRGHEVSAAALLDALRGRIADWWMPDAILIAPMPLAATGKIDKLRLRSQLDDGSLSGHVAHRRSGRSEAAAGEKP